MSNRDTASETRLGMIAWPTIHTQGGVGLRTTTKRAAEPRCAVSAAAAEAGAISPLSPVARQLLPAEQAAIEKLTKQAEQAAGDMAAARQAANRVAASSKSA